MDPEPRRGRRAPRPRGPAAGDRVHLQPGRVRRGRDPARAGQHPPDDRRRARRDLRPGRGGVTHPARGGPPRPGLPRVPRRADPRRRRAPRRAAAGVQAGRRGAVPGGHGQGRLRHRDPGPRHQHARPHGGDREAVEVERRDPRRPDAGGVHPAHRSRGAAWPRHRGPRRRALPARDEPRRGRRPRLHPHLSAPLLLPAVLQHGGQPRAPVRPRDVARAARAVLRPVPGRQGRRRAGPAGAQGRGGPRRLPRGRDVPRRRLHGVRRPAPADLRPREGGRAGASHGPPRGGDAVARQAAPRRRDPRARRQVQRPRGRDRPGPLRRRATPLRPHRRPPGAAPRTDGLPDPGGGDRAAADPQVVQRAQPGHAARPRDGAPGQGPRPRRPGGAARQAARLLRRHRRPTGRSHACAPSSRRTRATSAPSARTTPGGRSAGSSSSATPRP